MRLISCDGCGVMLDADKVKWPEIWDDEGDRTDWPAVWDGDRFVPVIPCPVCKKDLRDDR